MQLPQAFIQSIEKAKGFDKAAFEKVHESGVSITSVRTNPGKIFTPGSHHGQSLAFNIPLQKIPWSSNGYYLDERPSFTLDPLFHAGAYYVQEASSMFLEEALKQTIDLSKAVKILDLCAAPGGKSTLVQSVLNNESLLISNEVIKTRVNILSENITKWGAANVIVTNNDARDFQRLPNYFDAIIVDAPCSGSGLFRKDATAINEWSLQNVGLCSQRQQRILADVLPALKDNGVLIYSTCSYSEKENEEMADWLMEELRVESVKLKTENEWGVIETQSAKHKAYGYRFYPDKVKGEGFFIAAFKKTGNAGEIFKPGRKKIKNETLNDKEIESVMPYLNNTDDFFFIKQNGDAIAAPKKTGEDLSIIQNCLYIKKAGTRLGTIIRNELLPHHELALSNIINKNTTAIDVDEATALQYLRKLDIPIETSQKGWVLVKYMQLPLGWVKILPNRINNYYPKEWRILNK